MKFVKDQRLQYYEYYKKHEVFYGNKIEDKMLLSENNFKFYMINHFKILILKVYKV